MKKLLAILVVVALVGFVYAPIAQAGRQCQGQGQLQGQGQGQCQGQDQSQSQQQCSLSAGIGVGIGIGVGVAYAQATALSDGELATISVKDSECTTIDIEYSNQVGGDGFGAVNGINMIQQTAGVNNDVGQTITISMNGIPE